MAIAVALLACVLGADRLEAAAVGPAGHFTDFSSRPSAADWSTRSIAGGAGGAADAVNALQVDTNLSHIAASSITNQVLDLSPLDPAGTNALATWTSADGGFLQTRPVGVRLTLLMATLVNNTGSNVDAVNIGFTLRLANPVAEEIPGQRIYSSLTGDAGTWVNLAAPAVNGPVNATLHANWLAGARLYILFVDDNGSGSPDEACQVDNFSVTTAGGGIESTAISIVSPADGLNIVEGARLSVNAVASGGITDAGFFLDGNFVGSDAAAPYSVTISNLSVGAHTLVAVANSNVQSAPVQINVVANHPPAVALATSPGGTVLVGSNIVNTAVITDTDPGGSIQRVEFFVDDEAIPRFVDASSPFTFELCDVLAGTHRIAAVAVDQAGARGTNVNSLIATNPADITVIIPNGSTWKYFDRGFDQGAGGVPWAGLGFDDSGWSNGVAEFGYGDSGNNRPETTAVAFGPNANAKFITTYFRKTFAVENPARFTNLILRLLRDDGGIVYLNGTEAFRSYMTNGVVTSTTPAGLAGAGPASPDDGTSYAVTNISNMLVAGDNVVAVEIHQETSTSSDISFDLMLWGQGAAGPALTLTRLDDSHAEIRWRFPSTGYVLKSAPAPDSSAASWLVVSEADAPDAEFHHVIINMSGGTRFFRLEGQ